MGEALPKAIERAQNGDKIIVTTHLIRESCFKKLPLSPTIKPTFPFDRISVIITVFVADLLRFIIYVYKICTGKETVRQNRMKRKSKIKDILANRIKRIIKILFRRSYKIIWEK